MDCQNQLARLRERRDAVARVVPLGKGMAVLERSLPGPMLSGLPLVRGRWLQVRECPTYFIGITSSD